MEKTYMYELRVKEDAIPYLKKVGSTTKVNATDSFNSPDKITKAMIDVFDCDSLLEEYTWIMCVDTKLHVCGFFRTSHGTENASTLSTAGIFRRALLSSAYAIVLVHNHPSGDCTPSTEDLNLTQRVIEAGKIIGINVVDHIIIGRNGKYNSLRENSSLQFY